MTAHVAAMEAAGSRARDVTQLRASDQSVPVWTVTLAEIPDIIEAALLAYEEER